MMPRTKGQAPLTREQIIRAAMQLVDDEGMEKLSMRRLADTLGVKPMTLYYYFEDKSALLYAIIDAVLAECVVASEDSWDNRLRSLCRSLRGVARRHPAIFVAAMSYEQTVPADFAIAEAFLDALSAGAVPPDKAVRGYHTLITFVTGFAVDEIAGLLFTFDGTQTMLDALPTERFPQLHRHRQYLTAADPDQEFEYGLNALIDGIGAERQEQNS
jgi:AcrR family transcriptional regulator